MLWWSQAFSPFSSQLKVRIQNLIDLPIFLTFFFFFFFFMKFHTFLTAHNFEKSLRSRNFLSTILDMVQLFFERKPFFWRNCLMRSFYVQLSFLPFSILDFFLSSFVFISLTTKGNISFQVQLIKKSVLRILINRVWIWYVWGVKFMF